MPGSRCIFVGLSAPASARRKNGLLSERRDCGDAAAGGANVPGSGRLATGESRCGRCMIPGESRCGVAEADMAVNMARAASLDSVMGAGSGEQGVVQFCRLCVVFPA